MYFQLPKQKGL